VFALSRLFIDEVAVGARQLKLRIDGIDDSVIQGGLELELHDCGLPDSEEGVPQGLLCT
jgi:hypothetical protein